MLDTRQERMSFTFRSNRNEPLFRTALEAVIGCSRHCDGTNRLVNQPMLQAMARLLLGDKVSSAPAKPFEELMFYEC